MTDCCLPTIRGIHVLSQNVFYAKNHWLSNCSLDQNVPSMQCFSFFSFFPFFFLNNKVEPNYNSKTKS